ncbi:uncharacterized protein LOC144622878 isoform X2 [Crassostrea virginica]
MNTDIMRGYIYWALLTLCYQRLQAEICRPKEDEKCCSGYKRNETTGLCDNCPLGYNGPQCAYPCTYPYYGKDCLYKCDCTEEQCDFVFGCKATSKANTVQVTKRSEPTGTKDLSEVQTSEKSDEIGAKNSEVGHTEETTAARPTSVVFYITIALISVCVVFLLIYGVSFFLKQYFLRKQRINLALNVGVEEPVYSHYEEVKSTHI